MSKFAVFYVPDKGSELYRVGSSIVGYDIRAQETVKPPDSLRKVPGFTSKWLARARPYGFHLTVGDCIDFDLGQISAIEREVSGIIGCFNPRHEFTLKARQENFITFWGQAVVLRYDANDYLKMLHVAIAARVHPMGTGSGYLRRFLHNPETQAGRPYRVRRTLRFYSPTIFDGYSPHFTVLNPYTGETRQDLVDFLTNTFSGFKAFSLKTLCLVVQMSEGENWRIYKEYELA